MNKLFCFKLLLVLCIFLSLPLFEAIPLDVAEEPEALVFMKIPMVTSVGFFEMEQRKASGHSTVFTSEDIGNLSARSVEELLYHYTPGLNTARREYGTLIGQRGIQIDSNAKTTYMLDGKNLNMRTHLGYMLPLNMPFMGYIDRIEIINGPGTIVHGTGAINGFINVLPKTGSDYPGLMWNTEYGYYDELGKTELGYGKAYNSGDVYFYLGLLKATGARPRIKGDMRYKRDGSDYIKSLTTEINKSRLHSFDPLNFQALVNWNYDKFNLLAEYLQMFHQGEDALGWFADSGSYCKGRAHAHLLIRPKYTWELSSADELELEASMYVVNAGRFFHDDRKYLDASGSALRGSDSPSEVEFAFKGIHKITRWDKHLLAWGTNLSLRYFYDIKSFFLKEEHSTDLTSGPFFNWVEWSLFGEDVIDLTDKWTFFLGGRLNGVTYASNEVSTGPHQEHLEDRVVCGLSPKVAGSYKVNEDIICKLSYQRGFRFPDVATMLRRSDVTEKMEPEYMDSIELNYSHNIPEKSLNFDCNLFYNIFTKTIGWDYTSGANGFANLSKRFRALGVETIAKWKPIDDVTLDFKYGWARPHKYSKTLAATSAYGPIMPVSIDGREFCRAPSHYFKSSLTTLHLNDRLTLHTSASYFMGIKDTAYGNTHPIYQGGRLEWDIMGKYKVTEDKEVRIILKNMTRDESAKVGVDPLQNQPKAGQADFMAYLEFKMKM